MIDIQFKKSNAEVLKQTILDKSATIAVLGLGYVGLPTALHYNQEGYRVLGVDISASKVESLQKGKSYIDDISDEQLKEMLDTKFEATTDLSKLSEAHVIFICVPTPINDAKEPDLSFVEAAGKIISNEAAFGTLVVLESTTYPGTTEKFIAKPLEENGFSVGENIFVAYSPERIDPGNEVFDLSNTPKIVGGVTDVCADLAEVAVGKTAHKVSDVRTAELTKVFENTFRWVNIAVVNEMAMFCKELDIDVWEMLDAAGTKPYGFMKFEPGVGVGGHCIPVDPYYLSFIMKQMGKRTKMIDVSGEINDGMVRETYFRMLEIMNSNNKSLNASKVVILGAAYKQDIGDVRESPVMTLINQLTGNVGEIEVVEPLASKECKFPEGVKLVTTIDYEALSKADLVVIGTPHKCFDYEKIANSAKLIFDTKNVYSKQNIKSENIIKL